MPTLRRALVGTAAAAALAASALTAAAPASAHSIIELNGAPAYAGRTSTMTMEIQHGCMPSQPTYKVVIYFSSRFGAIVPLTVKGWRAVTGTRANGTKYVVWKSTNGAQPFPTPLYLRMRITWPRTPGTYGMPTQQFCVGGGSWYWNTPWQPATANVPSPPLTPLPTVVVKAR